MPRMSQFVFCSVFNLEAKALLLDIWCILLYFPPGVEALISIIPGEPLPLAAP